MDDRAFRAATGCRTALTKKADDGDPNDGDVRVLEGTPKQIAESMHALDFGQDNRTLSEYIAPAVGQGWRMNEIDPDVTDATDDHKTNALVRGMLAAGLAEKL
jgi:hypothetical protein